MDVLFNALFSLSDLLLFDTFVEILLIAVVFSLFLRKENA